MSKIIKLACGMLEERGPTFQLTVERYEFQKELVVSRNVGELPDVCEYLGMVGRDTTRGTVPVQRWADPDGNEFIVYGTLEEGLN